MYNFRISNKQYVDLSNVDIRYCHIILQSCLKLIISKKVLLRNMSKGEKKIVNVTINLMDFKEKQNRLEDFEYNVIPCLRNEILSRSIVIHDHESGVDTITDK